MLKLHEKAKGEFGFNAKMRYCCSSKESRRGTPYGRHGGMHIRSILEHGYGVSNGSTVHIGCKPEEGPAKIGLISDMATYPMIFINKWDQKIRHKIGLITDLTLY